MTRSIDPRLVRITCLSLALIVSLSSRASGQDTEGTEPDGTEPTTGFEVARGDDGLLSINLWTYVRYLNQLALDETYTDAFGRTSTLDLRQDIQHQKVTVYFRGWVLDPRLRYQLFVWTANPNQELSAQVKIAGYLGWKFGPRLALYGGNGALPSTRSTQGTFPNWLRVDNRTIADEFFRGSYTFGVWARGSVVEGLSYAAMLGNNLSNLGVDAKQLDSDMSTISAALWWMPTTGEFGPLEAYGDFEHHDELATLIGVHFTRSREDDQSLPDGEAAENVQIRLSDGTNLFAPDPFATGGHVTEATYRMLSVDAGAKLRGLSLDAEYFARWVDDLETTGPIPESSLFDQGFQLQASAMLHPRRLQGYLSGSLILGEYGDPRDLAAGLNFFPLRTRSLRLNAQLLHVADAPVGYSSLPFPLGGNGVVFSTDVELYF